MAQGARDPEIARAMESVAAAAAGAECDASRPAYHFRPPAQWMNDPNGPIFHGGYYHLFYQHNPYGDAWDHMHWGHARSRDLVRWEHLPIALRPSLELGEKHCFSGCCHLDASGRPVILYTSVPPQESGRPFAQWAAAPDDGELLSWSKPAANPAIDLATHGGPAFRGDWRDPYVFEHRGRTFLALGAVPECPPGRPGVALYESASPDLLRWTYRGMLFEVAGDEKTFLECPNFFRLGDRWVLFASPNRPPVERWVGSFDPEAARFAPDPGDSHGNVDWGGDFYASNVFFDDRRRCILLGWVRGFPPGKGWNGCLALPRLLRLENGRLMQDPVPEISSLRAERVHAGPFAFGGTGETTTRAVGGEGFAAEQLELQVELERTRGTEAGIRLLPSGSGATPVAIRWSGGSLDVAGVTVPLPDTGAPDTLVLRVFVDRSVLEVFVNRGTECVTRTFAAALPLRAELYAAGGRVGVRRLEAWQMKPVW